MGIVDLQLEYLRQHYRALCQAIGAQGGEADWQEYDHIAQLQA